MTKIGSDEIQLVGRWILVGTNMVADKTCLRIQDLVTNHLQYVAHDASGWETLFRDPDDGRFWESYFPHGEMQGGGPPSLRVIDADEAKRKYKLLP
jgi:hypothetical protein